MACQIPQPQPRATGTVSFSAREPDELAESARHLLWNCEYLALGRRFRTEVVAAQAPHSQLLRVNFRSPSIARGETPPDAYVFALMRRPGGGARLEGEELTQCNVGVIRPGSGYEFHASEGADLLLFSIGRVKAESTVLALGGRSLADAGERSTLRFRDPHTGRTLASTWMARLEQFLRFPDTLGEAETAGQTERDLLEGLLREVTLRGRPAPIRREAARRAAAYLGEHWREPLRLEDICRSAGAPERTLRQGFEELYGRAPISYLRLLRLRAAREMLRRAPAEVRILDVALRCGFTHPGSFSVEYRRAFGETPSQTRSR